MAIANAYILSLVPCWVHSQTLISFHPSVDPADCVTDFATCRVEEKRVVRAPPEAIGDFAFGDHHFIADEGKLFADRMRHCFSNPVSCTPPEELVETVRHECELDVVVDPQGDRRRQRILHPRGNNSWCYRSPSGGHCGEFSLHYIDTPQCALNDGQPGGLRSILICHDSLVVRSHINECSGQALSRCKQVRFPIRGPSGLAMQERFLKRRIAICRARNGRTAFPT